MCFPIRERDSQLHLPHNQTISPSHHPASQFQPSLILDCLLVLAGTRGQLFPHSLEIGAAYPFCNMSTSKLFKPLPDQPTAAPSDLNQPKHPRNAAKRAKRHAKKEAARKPEERLLNRTDLDVRGKKLYTLLWLKQMDTIMRRWCEFHNEILGSTSGPDYFKEGGPLPDRLLVHQFMFWLADTGEGIAYRASFTPSNATENLNITVATAEKYFTLLCSAFKYYNQALPQDMRSNSRLFIKNNLARTLDLNREGYSKTIAYHRDVELVLTALWDFKALATVKSIFGMFNCTLLVNLLIDGASRIGEFLPQNALSQTRQMFLKWQDLEFFALPDGNGGITIFIIVTCKWLKNQTLNNRGFKRFTVYLLSPHFAFQDTCRMLVILALRKGLFKHFRTWEELLSCTPSPYGSPLILKDSCLNDPVITSPDAEMDGSDSPAVAWQYQNLYGIISHISRLAGFKDRLQLTSLRRGDAYILEKYCKNRMTAGALMGHRDDKTLPTYISLRRLPRMCSFLLGSSNQPKISRSPRP